VQDDWARPVMHWEIVALDPDRLRAINDPEGNLVRLVQQ
jgi:hypothetical protein